MFFDSKLAQDYYNASASRFQPSYLLFRSPSEHTINGHHTDLEMQVIHTAQSNDNEANIKYGSISVFFSVEEFAEIDEVKNKTFQDFFRHFKFDDTEDKTVSIINFGDAMSSMEYEDRWTYKGSLSEPPCDQYVYWNVLRTIYPIELDRFDYFKKYMKSKEEYLGGYKNNRKI